MEIDYLNLLGLALVAVGAPLLMDALRLPVSDAVAMILAGIALGSSGLGWGEVDDAVELLSALGLAYLLFVAGMEIRVYALSRQMLGIGVLAFGVSSAVAVGSGLGLQALALVQDLGVVIAALLTTSIGIVVVVLKDSGRLESPVGQITLLGALLGDFASVALLSVLFVGDGASMSRRLLGLGLFLVAGLSLAGLGLAASMVPGIRRAVVSRFEGATQIAVRMSFAFMVGLAALAQIFGPEAILGAFLAGVAVSAISDRATGNGNTRLKLEVVGFGLLAPMFFVTAGLRFDLGALTGSAGSLVLVPLLLVAMIATRALPALLFSRILRRRELIASGLLLSTKLTFVVAAVQIGTAEEVLAPATASALITAAIITVLVLPTIASVLLRTPGGDESADEGPTVASSVVTVIKEQHREIEKLLKKAEDDKGGVGATMQ